METTVRAVWEDRIPARFDAEGKMIGGSWTSHGDEPETLRASLAPKRLTVWLPSGARVVCRRSHRQVCDGNHMDRVFYHHWRNRHGDARRIVFTIADNVPLNGEGE
jgi:hypothetical protein